MQLRLGTRLGLGYGAVITALFLVFVLSVAAFEVSRSRAVELQRNYFPSIVAVNEMLQSLDRMERAEYRGITDPQGARQAFRTFDQEASGFRGSLVATERLAHTPEEQQAISALGQSFGSYLNVDARLRSLIQKGRRAEASQLNLTESAAVADEVRQAGVTFRRENLRAILAEQQQVERVLRWAEWLAVSLALLGVVLALFAWRRSVESVVVPLRHLAEATGVIASGRFITAHAPNAERTVEIAVLQRDFNSMSQELERTTRGLETQVTARTQQLETALEELERMVSELRTLDKMKSDLMAVVSHELLTPINFIMAYGSTLEEEVLGPLSTDQGMAARRIVEGAQRLTRMVRNMLDYTQLESGRLAIRPEPLDLAPAVRDVVETMRPLAAEKSQTLELVLPPDLPPAWADPSRVAQILQELLDNAIKFTSERGRIRLAVRSEAEHLVTEVSDTGIGMSSEIQSNLFKGFYQADASSTRAYGGLGLGLAIVYHLVTRMGGRLSVDSSPGSGSTFRFTLPRADRRPD
ncbi:MAG TPA: ATP-binding protein [Stenomitos sp.]